MASKLYVNSSGAEEDRSEFIPLRSAPECYANLFGSGEEGRRPTSMPAPQTIFLGHLRDKQIDGIKDFLPNLEQLSRFELLQVCHGLLVTARYLAEDANNSECRVTLHRFGFRTRTGGSGTARNYVRLWESNLFFCLETDPSRHLVIANVYRDILDKRFTPEGLANEQVIREYYGDITSEADSMPEDEVGEAQGLFDSTLSHSLDEATLNSLQSLRVTHDFDAQNIGSVLKGLQSMVAEEAEGIANSILDRIKDVVFILSQLVPLFVSQFSFVNVSCALIGLFTYFSVPSSLFLQATQLIERFFPQNIAQASFAPDCQAILGVVGVFLTVLLTFSLPKAGLLADMSQIAANYGKGILGFKALLSTITDVSGSFVKAISQHVYGYDITAKAEPNFKAWFDEVNAIAERNVAGCLSSDPVLSDRVEKCFKEGLVNYRLLKTLDLAPRESETFRFHMGLIWNIQRRNLQVGVRANCLRQEPLVVSLVGETGIGKSTLLWRLAQDILKLDGPELAARYKDEIYFRNVAQDFWDGYNGQTITVYDDFGQRTDSAVNPNPEFFELIRTNNMAPFPLHMAELEEKARTFFKSRVVLLTSNRRTYATPSMTHNKAFQRRLEIRCNLVVNPLYATLGALDSSKVAAAVKAGTIEEFSPDLWNFEMLDEKGNVTSTHTYSQFFKEIENMYAGKRAFFADYSKFLDSRVGAAQVHSSSESSSDSEDDMSDCRSLPDSQSNHSIELDDGLNWMFERTEVPADPVSQQLSLLRERMSGWKERVKTFLSSYSQSFAQTFGRARSLFLNNWKKISGALSICALLFGVWKFMKPLALVAESDSRVENRKKLNVYVAESSRRRKAESDSREPMRKGPRYLAEAVSDVNSQEIVGSVAAKNLFKIRTDDVDRMNILFVRGRVALAPAHLIPYLEHRSQNGIEICGLFGQRYFCKQEELKFYRLGQGTNAKDLCLIEFPPVLPDRPDIFHHFVKHSDLPKIDNVNATLVTLLRNDLKCGDLFSLNQFNSMKLACLDSCSYDSSYETYYLRKGYSYNADTKNGDCGGPLIVHSNTFTRKICGLHVASVACQGVSVPFTQEEVQKYLDLASRQAQIRVDVDHLLPGVVEVPKGEFVPLGKVGRSYRVPGTTDIHPSPIHRQVVEPITGPTVKNVRRTAEGIDDPLRRGLEKCGAIPPRVDPELLSRCVKAYENKLAQKTTYKRVLTFEEAVMGVEGDNFIPPVNRRSSPGYPWVDQRKGTNGKHKWLGSEEYVISEDLERAVQQRINDAKVGIRTPTLWIDTLKDERVSLRKIQDRKTRVFSAAPQDYVLAVRQYFGGFVGHMTKTRIQNECAVGINPYSIEWTHLAQHLSKKGSRVVAGDFSNFDGSLSFEVLYQIGEMIIRWYEDPVNEEIRRTLWAEIVGSMHIMEDNVYMWTHSQPSGNPLTVVINSIYNSLMMRYAWCLAMKGTQFGSLTYFDHFVSFISYGDDNVINIADCVLEEFNQVKLTEFLALTGLTYTMENKEEEVIPHRALSEVTFLKRQFRWDAEYNKYDAPWDLSSLLELSNWVRGKESHDKRCSENVEKCFEELSLHGEEIFDEWTPKLRKVCRKMSVQPKLYSYHDYKLMPMNYSF